MCRTDEHITKQCRVCEQSKPIEQFKRCGKTKAGNPRHDTICKECQKVKDAEYRANMSLDDLLRYRNAHKKYRYSEKGKGAISKIKARQKQSGWSVPVYWAVCEECKRVELKKAKPRAKKCTQCLSREWWKNNYGTLKYKLYKRPAGSVGVCDQCGVEYRLTGGGNEKRCPACRIQKYKEERRNAKRRRKNVKRIIGPVERVIDVKVFDRDKWKCRACGVKVHKHDINAPDAAEVDHIVPIAKGGVETYSNVQTLCRRCNQKKRDQLIGQLVMQI